MKKKQVTFKKSKLINLVQKFLKKATTVPSTKFGGQPDWLEGPQWPICHTTGLPMEFVCQVSIDKDLFPKAKGKMAYIFITDGPYFWKDDQGDNAVIIQPGGKIPNVKTSRQKGSKLDNPIFSANYEIGTLPIRPKKAAPEYIEVEPLATGPSVSPILPFVLNSSEDPDYHKYSFNEPDLGFEMADYDDESQFDADYEKALDEFYHQLSGTKVGGLPLFIQEEEYPSEPKVDLLLLQIDCSQFSVCRDGFLYIFINKEGTKGRMLYQR